MGLIQSIHIPLLQQRVLILLGHFLPSFLIIVVSIHYTLVHVEWCFMFTVNIPISITPPYLYYGSVVEVEVS